MDFSTFEESLVQEAPPEGLSLALQALWHDANGDWDEAHRLAQQQDDHDGAWVHAYLHRKEGDPSNAAYWYRRAHQPVSHRTLEEEWQTIAETLLDR